MLGVIDRFEGEYAVVILDDETVIDLKRNEIPEEAKEGDVLNIADNVTIDVEETEKRKKKAEEYLKLWED